MAKRVIRTAGCIAIGARWLAKTEPRFAPHIERLSPLPLRLKPEGFLGLLDIINGQQVSVASANAINARVREAELTTPAAILAANDDDLRAVGFSKQKIRYARALAEADLDFTKLSGRPTDEAVKTLTALPGIGSWTAEIYVKFAMLRADVFAAGDLALQEAIRDIWQLDARPSEKQAREMALAWSPWRSVAARLLWAYYTEMIGRKGII